MVDTPNGAEAKPTLLLVDDEEGHLLMASKILGRHYKVITANGGAQALPLAQQHQPDLALVDYRMPGMTGNEVLEQLSQLVPRCLRILVTGDSDRGTLQEAVNRGKIYRFVSKPVAYPTLMEDLRLALDHRRAQDVALEAERLAVAGLISCIAAHDIRNGLQGLAAVPMYINLGTPEDLGAAIEAAGYAQSIMSDCVEEILAVAKGRAVAVRRAPVLLQQLVERICSYEERAISERTLVREVKADLPPVSVNEAHCRRLLGNLIRNAAQATAAGGTITVKVWRSAPNRLAVSVGDDGPGIPPQVQERMFKPFNSTKGAAGSGFGLKMCKDVMDSHRGELTFASQPGSGTTFTASFPLEQTS